jgi:signal transduction histidine kinase/CheY-like chemotaxis protein
MLVFAIAALFSLVFGRALVACLRYRDRLHAAVLLVFTSVAALFFLQVAREIMDTLPEPLRVATAALLFGQPFFTLGLVALIRTVSTWAVALTGVGWIVACVTLMSFESPMPTPARYGVVGYFVITELLSAVYLFVEARRRTGATAARLYAAAGGTSLFAVAMFTAGGGSATAARVVALGSALGYVMAFMPPRWLRRIWSARAAYALMGRLVRLPSTATPEQTWQHYVDMVQAAGAADAAVVVSLEDAGPRAIATVGSVPGAPGGSRLDALLRRAFPPGCRSWPGAVAIDGHFAAAIPLTLHASGIGALLVLSRHRSLFTEDDATLLAELGRQATAVADRRVLTTQLTALVEELRAANEAKNDFVAAMSHELRTPLNAIIGFSELMGYEESVGDRRLVPIEWIDNVHSSGRHLLGLINDVLDLAKVESGRMDLRLEALDVGAAVAEAVAPLNALVAAKSLRLTVAVPPLSVRADRMRLRQMLNNLLSNAIKFTPEAGAVYISAHRTGAQVYLTVADTGPGIDPADHERVFEEFHQSGDAQSRSAGTGLGLALTRRLAGAHDGRVELWSEPGQGSRFTLVLPVGTEPEPPAADPGAGTGGGAVGGVLLIEDDVAAASLLQTYLVGAGYAVRVAGTGEDGLRMARQCAPDAILLDVLLPGMDGWAVLKALKADERLRNIPVLVVTVVDEREVGLALGAVDYYVKPVERAQLLAWLTRHGLVPATQRGRRQVLVVDAAAASLATVVPCLVQEGLAVATADTGAQALHLAREQEFDLVICDLQVPDADTLLGALHDDPATRDVPVLVLTDADLPDAEKDRLVGNILAVTSRDHVEPADLRHWLDLATQPVRRSGAVGAGAGAAGVAADAAGVVAERVSA